MKDAYELLYQKQADLERVRREIESLRIAASLVAEDNLSFFEPDKAHDGQNRKPARRTILPQPEVIPPHRSPDTLK